MDEHLYTVIRAGLVREFWFLKSKKLRMSARARVRKIAKLDFEQYGTPIEETKQKFGYDKLK